MIVGDTGEPFVVLKPNELESAVNRPRQLWHYEQEDDVAVLAVRLMLGIAQNHPFAQGNKRTGFEAANIFLEANGWDLAIEDYSELGDLIIIAIGTPAVEPELAELFREHLEPIG